MPSAYTRFTEALSVKAPPEKHWTSHFERVRSSQKTSSQPNLREQPAHPQSRTKKGVVAHVDGQREYVQCIFYVGSDFVRGKSRVSVCLTKKRTSERFVLANVYRAKPSLTFLMPLFHSQSIFGQSDSYMYVAQCVPCSAPCLDQLLVHRTFCGCLGQASPVQQRSTTLIHTEESMLTCVGT